jgi:hypothetical protein
MTTTSHRRTRPRRSRAYRWKEDGNGHGVRRPADPAIRGLEPWNGVDPILTDRMFGLTAPEGAINSAWIPNCNPQTEGMNELT